MSEIRTWQSSTLCKHVVRLKDEGFDFPPLERDCGDRDSEWGHELFFTIMGGQDANYRAIHGSIMVSPHGYGRCVVLNNEGICKSWRIPLFEDLSPDDHPHPRDLADAITDRISAGVDEFASKSWEFEASTDLNSFLRHGNSKYVKDRRLGDLLASMEAVAYKRFTGSMSAGTQDYLLRSRLHIDQINILLGQYFREDRHCRKLVDELEAAGPISAELMKIGVFRRPALRQGFHSALTGFCSIGDREKAFIAAIPSGAYYHELFVTLAALPLLPDAALSTDVGVEVVRTRFEALAELANFVSEHFITEQDGYDHYIIGDAGRAAGALARIAMKDDWLLSAERRLDPDDGSREIFDYFMFEEIIGSLLKEDVLPFLPSGLVTDDEAKTAKWTVYSVIAANLFTRTGVGLFASLANDLEDRWMEDWPTEKAEQEIADIRRTLLEKGFPGASRTEIALSLSFNRDVFSLHSATIDHYQDERNEDERRG
jgi:hypothetical protein